MKSPETILRDAVYAALSGSISYNSVLVPVYSAIADPSSDLYIVLEETNSFEQSTKQLFSNDVTLTIEIVHYQDRAATYTIVDSIYNDMMEILLPSVNTPGFTVATGWQAVKVRAESTDFVEQVEQTIVRRIVRLKCSMIQY